MQKKLGESKIVVAQQKKSFLSPPRSSISPVPPPTQFATSVNSNNVSIQQLPSSLQKTETDSGLAKGEQYSTFSSNGAKSSSSSSAKFFSYSKATKSETISSKAQQTNSSSTLSSGAVHGGIQVLPSAPRPVKLEEPPLQPPTEKLHPSTQKRSQEEFQTRSFAKTGKVNQKTVESIEADQFIEQLMREAETDPKLRELTYGKSGGNSNVSEPLKSMPPPSGPPRIYAAPKPPPPPTSDSPLLGESYPMVQRPYRTQQDMIIKDRDDSPTNEQRLNSRPLERHKMQKRPYRTNEDIKIVDVSARSQSADGRLNVNAYRSRDPKLDNFASVASVENVASATGSKLLKEVVTDNEHQSVRDLVRMMETNTHSESVNPYIRKWGCDLISPEPHSRHKTYRREKREMPKPFLWRPPAPGAPQPNDPRFASHYSQQGQADPNESVVNDVSYTSGDNTNTTIDNEFNMNDHVTDMNSLLGRSQGTATLTRYEDELMNQTGSSCMSKLGGMEDESYGGPQRTATPVIWPPLSPVPQQNNAPPTEVDSQYIPNGVSNRSPIPPSPPPPPPALLLTQDLQEKAKRPLEVNESQHKYGRSLSSGRAMENTSALNHYSNQSMSNGTTNGARNSLTEIDRQIVTIQNEFEAELDTLIDAYRKLQQTKRKEGVNVEGTDFSSTVY